MLKGIAEISEAGKDLGEDDSSGEVSSSEMTETEGDDSTG